MRTRHHARAAVVVAEAAGQAGPAPMDTLAEVNRVAAVALAAAGDLAGAGAAFERAARILGTVGNRTAPRRPAARATPRPSWPASAGTVPCPPGASARCDALPRPPPRVTVRLDAVAHRAGAPRPWPPSAAAIRAATIIDAGGYPEVLAHEVARPSCATPAPRPPARSRRPARRPARGAHAWWGCSWREARALAAAPPRAPRPRRLARPRTSRSPCGRPTGSRPPLTLARRRRSSPAAPAGRTRPAATSASAPPSGPSSPAATPPTPIFLSEAMNDIVASARKVAPHRRHRPAHRRNRHRQGSARARHPRRLRPRADRPFVPFNCTAVPRDMIDSQLFGYRRGAFTGAVADFPGVIRAAAGGTLFLDEIGELGLDVQPKLLRFLESGEIQPLGEPQPARGSTSASSPPPTPTSTTLVAEGRFREDLFYRLNVVRFPLPPLRERREEIPPLVEHFLAARRARVPEGAASASRRRRWSTWCSTAGPATSASSPTRCAGSSRSPRRAPC